MCVAAVGVGVGVAFAAGELAEVVVVSPEVGSSTGEVSSLPDLQAWWRGVGD